MRASAVGGRRASRRPLRALLALAAVAVPLSGCATKGDLRDVETQLVNLRARQDTIFLLLTDQNRAVRDSVFQVLNEVIRTRGDLRNDILRLEQQLIQIQQLAGQTQRSVQQQMSELQRRMDENRADLPPGSQPPAESGQPQEPVERPSGSGAEELYELGAEQLQRGAAATARMAFEQLLREHPNHPRAPDAQYQVAETLYQEQRLDEALRGFEAVVERYPNSPKAPEALYRAGIIAKERGNFDAARGYFRRVVAGYARSEAARLADEELRRLPNS